jgi:uncharacterized coiled-coil DUF342 family protein
MTDMPDTEIKIDVSVLKEQVSTLTKLCTKMDTLIDKIIDQQNDQLEKIYNEMEERRKETNKDISEVHQRIDTVLEKLQETELRIMAEMKNLTKEISQYRDTPVKMDPERSKKQLMRVLWEFKYYILGTIFITSYIASHMNGVDMKSILGIFIK